jgi:phosphoglycolate phosphatase-like HAD superfamily hydrolase
MRYKSILFFDMDDTSVEMGAYDFASVFGQSLEAETGRKFSKADVYGVFGIFNTDYEGSMTRLKAIGVDSESFFRRLEENDYLGRLPFIGNEIHMQDGVRAFLEKLRRNEENRIELFTSAPESITEMQLKRLGADGLFHAVHSSGYFTPDSKPRPHTLMASMERHGASPEHSWIFGDMRFDVMAGKAAGIKTGLKVNPAKKYEGPEPDLSDSCLVRLVKRALESE